VIVAGSRIAAVLEDGTLLVGTLKSYEDEGDSVTMTIELFPDPNRPDPVTGIGNAAIARHQPVIDGRNHRER
jgi:hypothetical protein